MIAHVERTPWFPADQFPVHRGVYEVRSALKDSLRPLPRYCFWSGGGWAFSGYCVDELYRQNAQGSRYVFQDEPLYEWRGVQTDAH